MIRHDPTNDKGQFMEDASGCDGIGTHKLCCPPEKVPTCGWYAKVQMDGSIAMAD